VKRLLAVVLGGLGLRALLRRRQSHPEPVDAPVEDLRQKLAEARAAVEEQIDETPPVDDRRADVHARARRAIDDLKS